MTRSASSDRFLLDAMLGKLVTYLRMCGYDATYILDEGSKWGREPGNDPTDDEILARVEASDRVLLTRDAALADRASEAVLLTTRDVRDQLRELGEAGYELTLEDPPTHCSACNGELRPVAENESLPSYTPDPSETECWRCRSCGQVFWKGSHWEDVRETLGGL
ncbi:hypothetical protein DVK02_02150 [Halobellus sp. Atlit-31R]|nr:hypothetical protein DVK02_02150 [Halobellus sp. Atlit-31R]